MPNTYCLTLSNDQRDAVEKVAKAKGMKFLDAVREAIEMQYDPYFEVSPSQRMLSKDVAAKFGVTTQSVRGWVKDGLLAGQRNEYGLHTFAASDVDEFVPPSQKNKETLN